MQESRQFHLVFRCTVGLPRVGGVGGRCGHAIGQPRAWFVGHLAVCRLFPRGRLRMRRSRVCDKLISCAVWPPYSYGSVITLWQQPRRNVCTA